jgi:hypothetical protein
MNYFKYMAQYIGGGYGGDSVKIIDLATYQIVAEGGSTANLNNVALLAFGYQQTFKGTGAAAFWNDVHTNRPLRLQIDMGYGYAFFDVNMKFVCSNGLTQQLMFDVAMKVEGSFIKGTMLFQWVDFEDSIEISFIP